MNTYTRESIEHSLTDEMLMIEDKEDTIWVVEGYSLVISFNEDHIFYKADKEIIKLIKNKLANHRWINKRAKVAMEQLIYSGKPSALEIQKLRRYNTDTSKVIKGNFMVGMRKADWDRFDDTEHGADQRGKVVVELLTSLMHKILTPKELSIIEGFDIVINIPNGKHHWGICRATLSGMSINFIMHCNNDGCDKDMEDSISQSQILEMKQPSILHEQCEEEEHDLFLKVDIDDVDRVDFTIECNECLRQSEMTFHLDELIRYFGLEIEGCEYFYEYVEIYYPDNHLVHLVRWTKFTYAIKTFFTEKLKVFFTKKIPRFFNRLGKAFKAFWWVLIDG